MAGIMTNGGGYITLGAVVATSLLGVASFSSINTDIVRSPRYSQVAGVMNEFGIYNTSFVRAEYHTRPALSDSQKVKMMSSVVASVTTDSIPLTADEHKILSDNLFDLL